MGIDTDAARRNREKTMTNLRKSKRNDSLDKRRRYPENYINNSLTNEGYPAMEAPPNDVRYMDEVEEDGDNMDEVEEEGDNMDEVEEDGLIMQINLGCENDKEDTVVKSDEDKEDTVMKSDEDKENTHERRGQIRKEMKMKMKVKEEDK